MFVVAPFVFALVGFSSVNTVLAAPIAPVAEVAHIEERSIISKLATMIPEKLGPKLLAAGVAGGIAGLAWPLMDKPFRMLSGADAASKASSSAAPSPTGGVEKRGDDIPEWSRLSAAQQDQVANLIADALLNPSQTSVDLAAAGITSEDLEELHASLPEEEDNAPALAQEIKDMLNSGSSLEKRSGITEIAKVFKTAITEMGPKKLAYEIGGGALMGAGMLGAFSWLENSVNKKTNTTTAATTSRRHLEGRSAVSSIVGFLGKDLGNGSAAKMIIAGLASTFGMVAGANLLYAADKKDMDPSLTRRDLLSKDSEANTNVERAVAANAVEWIATGAVGLGATLGAGWLGSKFLDMFSHKKTTTAPTPDESSTKVTRRWIAKEVDYSSLD